MASGDLDRAAVGGRGQGKQLPAASPADRNSHRRTRSWVPPGCGSPTSPPCCLHQGTTAATNRQRKGSLSPVSAMDGRCLLCRPGKINPNTPGHSFCIGFTEHQTSYSATCGQGVEIFHDVDQRRTCKSEEAESPSGSPTVYRPSLSSSSSLPSPGSSQLSDNPPPREFSPDSVHSGGVTSELSGSTGSLCQLDGGQSEEVVPASRLGMRRSSLPAASPLRPSRGPLISASGQPGKGGLGVRANVRCGHCQKNGYSSLEHLERLERRPRPKCLLKAQSSAPLLTYGGERDDGGGALSDSEFVRQKRERSTFLVRRFQKNNQKIQRTVCPGARTIMRTLLSGGISMAVWDAVCESTQRANLPESSQRHQAALLLIQLQVSKALLSYPGLRLKQVRTSSALTLL